MESIEPAAGDVLMDLLARTALRDRAAFQRLYQATVRCLYGITVRLLRDPDWSEEVLQEAYVNIWNSASHYVAAKSQPMTWLMAIARNKALDALRSTNTERSVLVRPSIGDDDDATSGPPDIADEAAGPLERLIRGVEADRLRHCLGALEGAQRQAIALAFYDGLTHAELAAHLGAPLGTVKAWVRRGLERLQRCLTT